MEYKMPTEDDLDAEVQEVARCGDSEVTPVQRLVKWPDFRRHETMGWVCCECGRRCFDTIACRVHARLAVVGVGCRHKAI